MLLKDYISGLNDRFTVVTLQIQIHILEIWFVLWFTNGVLGITYNCKKSNRKKHSIP
jgi:hypothetical protein